MHYTNSLFQFFFPVTAVICILHDIFLRCFVYVDFDPHIPSVVQSRIFLQAVPQ